MATQHHSSSEIILLHNPSVSADGLLDELSEFPYARYRVLLKSKSLRILTTSAALFFHRRSGEAVTLVTRNDWKIAAELINILERGNQVIFYFI